MKEKKIFANQADEEKIIKILNRHFFTFIRDGVGSIFLFFASLATMILFFYIPYILPLAFLVFVFSIIGGGYSYFTWTRDRFIITDRRIVDVEQKTLFVKSQKEAYLEKIQDVSFEIKGFWGSIFNFGTINIQTASDTMLTLDDVYRPESIQNIIFNLIREKQTETSGEEGIFQKMTEMIKKAIKEERVE